MKIDPYYHWQKCRPVSVVSGCIRYVRIIPGIPVEGASNDSEVVDNGNFQVFRWLFFGYFEVRPALLYGDMQSVVDFSVIPKCMTSNDWLFRVKFCLRGFGWLILNDFRK